MDVEDPEYADIQLKYAIVQESYESDMLWVLEMDAREVDSVMAYIEAAPEFYVQELYEEVPFRHFVRILGLNSSITTPSESQDDKAITEMVMYSNR